MPAAAALLLACNRQERVRPSSRLLPTATPGSRPAAVATTYVAAGPPGPRRGRDFLALPLRLLVPRLGIDGPVVAVGLTPEGAMDVPQQAADVGWYLYGPRPGAQGNAILAGHVDWRGAVGVFARLRELRPGDTVFVQAADGQARSYAVHWLEEYLVEAAPVARVFEPLEVSALTLITCGGYWNPQTRRYSTRIVARAGRTG